MRIRVQRPAEWIATRLSQASTVSLLNLAHNFAREEEGLAGRDENERVPQVLAEFFEDVEAALQLQAESDSRSELDRINDRLRGALNTPQSELTLRRELFEKWRRDRQRPKTARPVLGPKDGIRPDFFEAMEAMNMANQRRDHMLPKDEDDEEAA